MKRTVFRIVSGALLLLSSATPSGCTLDSEKDTCDQSDALPATVVITQGQLPLNAPPPSTFPYVVEVKVSSDWLVRGVSVGGVSAVLQDASKGTWQASLSQSQLEAKREGDVGIARLAILVYDACNRGVDAKTDVVVPLGASPNAKVSGLDLSVTFAPETECALPTNQTAQAFVAVTASAASAGASVTIATSSGTFAGGATSLQLKLQPASGMSASPGTYFIPGPAGTALISAYADGATPVLRSVPIVGPPTVAAPVVSLRRDIEYPASVETAGNLQNCVVEKVSPSSSVVKITDPEALAGEIRGDVSVKEAVLSCSERERLALSISFTKDAPDDAAVTLRCFDTFGQQGTLTFKIAPPPATESSSAP